MGWGVLSIPFDCQFLPLSGPTKITDQGHFLVPATPLEEGPLPLRTQRTVGWQRELLTARVRLGLTGLSVLASVRHPFKPQGFQAKQAYSPVLLPVNTKFCSTLEPCILQRRSYLNLAFCNV